MDLSRVDFRVFFDSRILLRFHSLSGGYLCTNRTISWMDAIKRQFGLSHIDYSVRPKA